jgi:hypothetical protein
MSEDLYEQIWEEDIQRFAEDTLALWKTQYRLWQRAKTQGAPPALLEELHAISELFKETHTRLMGITVFFPKADK